MNTRQQRPRRGALRKRKFVLVISTSATVLVWLTVKLIARAPLEAPATSQTVIHNESGQVVVSSPGSTIVNSDTAATSHGDDRPGKPRSTPANPSGNNSGNDSSVEISGSSFHGDTVINTGSGDVNSHNITFNGSVDPKLVRGLLRSKLTPQQFIARYIDSTAQRAPDRPSIALHVLDIANFETTGIRDAADAALTHLGYYVPTLFRAPFAEDGLDKELFRGSAKLADQLQLRQHCDSVLLGEIQIKPANNLQGLFITEASFYVHQIAADSGAVARNMVIRAKGSGLNAEASAASALRELEESIKQQLAEWTLT